MLKKAKKYKKQREFTHLTYKLYKEYEKPLLSAMRQKLTEEGVSGALTKSKGVKLAIENYYNIKLEN